MARRIIKYRVKWFLGGINLAGGSPLLTILRVAAMIIWTEDRSTGDASIQPEEMNKPACESLNGYIEQVKQV